MAKDREVMSGLTLRQLRIKASELSIPLYSRKSKASLLKEIALYEERKEAEKNLLSFTGLKSFKENSSDSFAPLIKHTRVVFLPRDPEWAYVFW